MSDLSVRLFGLTNREVAQESESVTPSFGREGLPEQPKLFSKYVAVGIRLNELCSASEAALEGEHVASGQHHVDADQ